MASLSILLEDIEALYQDLCALTGKLESEALDSDNHIAIEDQREKTLKKVDLILEDVAQFLAITNADQELINEAEFLRQQERLLKWSDQVRDMDKKREILIAAEKSTLTLELQTMRLSAQAAAQYQKSIPI